MNQFYYMSDSGARIPPTRIKESEAKAWNDKKLGIFWTVNDFAGRRVKENITKINAWAIDIDEGDKVSMFKKLQTGLIPSLVVESKRSLHAYWFSEDATPASWDSICIDRLVPFYGADAKARDLCRLLRVPGYYHWKDPDDPFLIKTVFTNPVFYTVKKMLSYYPSVKEQLEKEIKHAGPLFNGDVLWDRLYSLDAEVALQRLHNHPALATEVISFQRHGNGTKQICINNKPTSCWIDRNKKIGSYEKGGPTIWQWLKWYGMQGKEIYKVITEAMPELCQK